MTTSKYFNHLTNTAEQNFFEDLVVESVQIGGHDVHYIPRNSSADPVLGDSIQNTFGQYFTIEAYIQNIEEYGGEGDLMSKFGLMIQDDLVMKITRRRFEEELSSIRERPKEGDLIYIGNPAELDGSFMNGVFQINYVSNLIPFWQLGRYAVYELRCSKFIFSHENFETGIDSLNQIFEDITLDVPEDNITFENKQNEMQDHSEENIFGDL